MKKLCLVHSLDGQTEYVEGSNCDSLVALNNGGYVIVRGVREDTVPAHRVLVFTTVPRPGLTPEPTPKPERNGLSPVPKKLPPGVKPSDNESRPWACTDCGLTSETLHGVRIHYNKVHARF